MKEDLLVHSFMDTPLGPLMFVYGDRGLLVRVAFEKEGFNTVLVKMANIKNVASIEEDKPVNIYTAQFAEYFSGMRKDFSLPFDFSLSTPFRKEVQSYLQNIPYGDTESYKSVASHVDKPTAIRAVGRACATNPLPIAIPCHRVLSSDNSLGGYINGLESKKLLLGLEKTSDYSNY